MMKMVVIEMIMIMMVMMVHVVMVMMMSEYGYDDDGCDNCFIKKNMMMIVRMLVFVI